MAHFALGNSDDALDVVQDAMMGFSRSYAKKPPEDWAPLFYQVLRSRISDCRRRLAVRNRFRAWFGGNGDDRDHDDLLLEVPDPANNSPHDQMERDDLGRALDRAIRSLPTRQQEAFLLRSWEGLDVSQTARAMQCSEGSVKTHYFRAVHALRELLEEYRQ
ncbi:RNA polymerase sigma factor [Geobacter sp. AOG2]|nr:RNA polymerase sigma factor [Geobacter sp. AOG2]